MADPRQEAIYKLACLKTEFNSNSYPDIVKDLNTVINAICEGDATRAKSIKKAKLILRKLKDSFDREAEGYQSSIEHFGKHRPNVHFDNFSYEQQRCQRHSGTVSDVLALI